MAQSRHISGEKKAENRQISTIASKFSQEKSKGAGHLEFH
jgi:hypothetical protein